MKLKHQIQAEIEGDILSIEDIHISNNKYMLQIENFGNHLFLKFRRGDLVVHEIIISSEGTQQKRLILQPTHDHDASEVLTPDLTWKQFSSTVPREEVLHIPFGMRISEF